MLPVHGATNVPDDSNRRHLLQVMHVFLQQQNHFAAIRNPHPCNQSSREAEEAERIS
jgi:hypothetical protein